MTTPLLALPLHPLVVHVAVCLISVAAASVLAVVRPRWRWALRTPSAVLNVIALGVLLLTRETGEELAHHVTDNRALVERHDQMAGILTGALVVLTVLSLVAWWAMPLTTTALASGRGRHGGHLDRWTTVLGWLVVVAAVATLVAVVLTGHSGAVAVWSG